MKKLTPAMDRAMDLLTGTTSGRLHRGQGVAFQTARALAARELVFLEGTARQWTMVLVEPEVQEITDAALDTLIEAEADLLRPLDPKRRYRALRHAHIARETWGKGALAIEHGDAARSRAAVLANRVSLVLAWQEGRVTDREYGKYRDLAGEQWKGAREFVTDTWYIGTGWGEAVLTVEAGSRDEAHAKADQLIAADPVGYKELVKSYGSRRVTVGDLVADRRKAAATDDK